MARHESQVLTVEHTSQLVVAHINLHWELLEAREYPVAQVAQVVVDAQVSQLVILQALLHWVPAVFLSHPVAQV